MQASNLSAFQHQPIQHPNFISIDETWLSKKIQLKQQLLICPVCYTIPLDYPIECSKCQRIFCKKDYQKITQNDDKCPTCKATPWIKKDQIHIAYKQMFDVMKLRCKVCSCDIDMSKEEIIQHLEEHNMFLSQQSILYDYTFISQNGIQLKLNLTQNLQINVRKSMGFPRFEIGGTAGKVLTVNLKQMTAQHATLGLCKVIQQKSKMLKRNKQYLVWTVDISDKQMQQGKQRFVFYSQEFQSIIEKNYQDFLKNQKFNEFCLDVRQTRFRISFSEMIQINTYTKSEKPILRIPFILR